MSSEDSVLLERNDACAIIVLHRPKVKNALDLAAMDALADVVTKVAADETVRAVIFTGAGEEAFCAGGDLKAFKKLTSHVDGEAMSLKMQRALIALERLEVPVIAVLNGYAMGGGCEAFLASDIRIAEAHAELVWKQLDFGVTTGWGAAGRLIRDIGERRALRMLLLRETLDAQQALAAGLVDEVVPKGAGRAHALKLAQKIAESAPLAVRMLKRSLRTLAGAQQPELEARLFAATWGSADHHEAVAAFFEKRPPRFIGR